MIDNVFFYLFKGINLILKAKIIKKLIMEEKNYNIVKLLEFLNL
jgi:hypothetical protein